MQLPELLKQIARPHIGRTAQESKYFALHLLQILDMQQEAVTDGFWYSTSRSLPSSKWAIRHRNGQSIEYQPGSPGSFG